MPLVRVVQVVPLGLVITVPPVPAASNWLDVGLTAS
jgi:hypothetical protein